MIAHITADLPAPVAPTISTWLPTSLQPPHGAVLGHRDRDAVDQQPAGSGSGSNGGTTCGEGVADQQPQLHPLRVRHGADPAVERRRRFGRAGRPRRRSPAAAARAASAP